MSPLQTRLFGENGPGVTLVGLGGEGVLRSHGKNALAQPVIEEAAAQGITYFDSARAYDESERYLGRFWEARPELRSGIFQTSKSARRDYAGAWADLETSLSNLHTGHLDLWQIHDLRSWEDVKAVESSSGALDAFREAKRQGKARNIGVTGAPGSRDTYPCRRELARGFGPSPREPGRGCPRGIPGRDCPGGREERDCHHRDEGPRCQ